MLGWTISCGPGAGRYLMELKPEIGGEGPFTGGRAVHGPVWAAQLAVAVPTGIIREVSVSVRNRTRRSLEAGTQLSQYHGNTCKSGTVSDLDSRLRENDLRAPAFLRTTYVVDQRSPGGSPNGSAGAGPGITNFSSAQAPRSIFLQRSEQNGRNLFASIHSTCLPQVGQATTVIGTTNQKSEIAEGQVERHVFFQRLGLAIAVLGGEAYPQHVLVGRDLGDRAKRLVQGQAQHLVDFTL